MHVPGARKRMGEYLRGIQQLAQRCRTASERLFARIRGKQYKLDEEGNKKVLGLLKGAKSKKGLLVSVEGTLDGETLHVKKIAEVES
jgi:hypothetical protein